MGNKAVYSSFSAIIGLKDAKLALLLSLVDPSLWCLLIGEKGTGKSTLVRSLNSILPPLFVLDPECPYSCTSHFPESTCPSCKLLLDQQQASFSVKPRIIITLPLSITEDRLVGGIDIEKTLQRGLVKEKPGILFEANNQILYIDELNLLPREISAILLESTYSEYQREFLWKPNFTLIGSYNEEEGTIFSHLSDRFSLAVKIGTIDDPDHRKQIIDRNLDIKDDQRISLQEQDKALRRDVQRARIRLSTIVLSKDLIKRISIVTTGLFMDGSRPDLAWIKSIRALAALNYPYSPLRDDIFFLGQLTLFHRSRDQGRKKPLTQEEYKKIFDKTFAEYEFRVHINEETDRAAIGAPQTASRRTRRTSTNIFDLLNRKPELIVMLLLVFGLVPIVALTIFSLLPTGWIENFALSALLGTIIALLLSLFIPMKTQEVKVLEDAEYWASVNRWVKIIYIIGFVVIPVSTAIIMVAITRDENYYHALWISIFGVPLLLFMIFRETKKPKKNTREEEKYIKSVSLPGIFASPCILPIILIFFPFLTYFAIVYGTGELFSIWTILPFVVYYGSMFMIARRGPGRGPKRGLHEIDSKYETGKPIIAHDKKKIEFNNLSQLPQTKWLPKEEIKRLQHQLKLKNETLEEFQMCEAFRDFYTSVERVHLTAEHARGLHFPFLGELQRKFGSLFKPKEHVSIPLTIPRPFIESTSQYQHGRSIGWRISNRSIYGDIHLLATIVEAAQHGINTTRSSKMIVNIYPSDIRIHRRVTHPKASIVFVLDLSSSMAQAIKAIKDAILKIHQTAYRKRDRIGIIACKDLSATVAAHPTTNLNIIINALDSLGISGLTPLASGIQKAIGLLQNERRRDANILPVMVLVSDGGTNVPLSCENILIEELQFKLYTGDGVREAVQDCLALAWRVRLAKIKTIIIKPVAEFDISARHGFKTLRRFQWITNAQMIIPTVEGDIEIEIDQKDNIFL